MKAPALFPDDKIEREVISNGKTVCGIDEVGRGAWAGPLVLAAVVPGTGMIDGIRDSKKVSPKKREVLSKQIFSWSPAIGFGIVSNNEIDQLGLSNAITLGSRRAISEIEKAGTFIDVVLLDGNYDFLKEPKRSVQTYIKGDNLSHLIASASIVAKVFRDTYMASEEVAGRFPEFMFESNKGYPSPIHKSKLRDLGPTPLHRVSWDIFEDSFPKSIQEALI